MIKHGWLKRRTDIVRNASWFGIPLRQEPPLPTRWEEFTFVREMLAGCRGSVLDAGCGFEPGVHIMPEIMAKMGRNVIALDLQQPMSAGAFGDGFPDNSNIVRMRGDFTQLPFENEQFDAYVIVSVIEHLSPEDASKAIMEAYRVLRMGGLFIATVDLNDPRDLLQPETKMLHFFDFGEWTEEEGEDLDPKVGYLVGRKI